MQQQWSQFLYSIHYLTPTVHKNFAEINTLNCLKNMPGYNKVLYYNTAHKYKNIIITSFSLAAVTRTSNTYEACIHWEFNAGENLQLSVPYFM